MVRQNGLYRITSTLGEEVRAFVPFPLPRPICYWRLTAR